MARKDKAQATVQAINANVLVQLVKSKSDNKVKIGEINGELGGRIRHHKELSGLDPIAYGVICKLDNKSEQDRAAILGNIQLYADMMIEKGRWQKHLGDLAEQAAAAAEANSNQPDNEPVPATDEQQDDPRPESLKRRHAEIEAEQKAAAEPPAETVATSNVTKLRRGIKKLETPAEAVVA